MKIGDGVTRVLWTDREAYTIIEINKSGTKMKIQRDIATLNESFNLNVASGGFVGHVLNNSEQTYTYTPDLNGSVIEISLRKDGNWYEVGSKSGRGSTRYLIGQRSEFYDYNF